MFGNPCSQRSGLELTGPIGMDVVQRELPALQLDPEVLDGLKYPRSLPLRRGWARYNVLNSRGFLSSFTFSSKSSFESPGPSSAFPGSPFGSSPPSSPNNSAKSGRSSMGAAPTPSSNSSGSGSARPSLPGGVSSGTTSSSTFGSLRS